MAALRALLALVAVTVWVPLWVPGVLSGPTPPPRSASVLLEPGSGRLRVLPGLQPAAVAWAELTDHIQAVGWAFLEVSANASFNDTLQAYAAGLAEAAVTEQLIYMHWMNTAVGYCGPFRYETQYCRRLRGYLEANLAWMEEQMGSGRDRAYWHQVRLTLLQLQGLEDSYRGRVALPSGRLSLSPFGFLLLQLGGDLEDLEAAFNSSAQQRPLGSGSCSALLKLLPGCQDLLVAHDTWAPYQSMLRLIKKYTLPFRAEPGGTARVPGSVQVFSSYPGTIFSGDDFYILSSGLVSAACTLTPPTSPAQPSHPHRSHWRPPLGTVTSHAGGTCGLKAASWNGCGTLWPIAWPAAVLSGPASSSASTVARRAGTQQGLLTVLEQIPGLVIVADKTELLYQQGYWASYNVPYFEEIFNASGNLELVLKYGDWFTYDKNPRAQIFRRNQSQVHDVDSMVRLMRSNNYLQDPLSQCRGCDPPHNAENAISARSDLNPANGTYPFAALHQRCHGGTDTKVTSFGMARSFGLVAASGPTWDDVPPFRWSTSPCSHLLHMGHPDLWRFPPIKVRWD
ncbi:putative phospholipase B-like 2 isoform X6 [Coturnix japonica]|uniref:putative phospholipase B-like 2 isoform X6 n=1 Tax=Coturnix japonica TaxID=93934 RepID=UPI000776CEFC|nr:putative phospholipase B-like 2 isoform X6 [Coturnix japonica]